MDDIRWEQRFSNFRRAFKRLMDNIKYIKSEEDIEDELDEGILEDLLMAMPDISKQGLIQSFEFTHELAWKVMKDYAEFQGNTEIKGSRDAIMYAAQIRLIEDAHIWLEMMKSRNNTSHTYNEAIANEIVSFILTDYQTELSKFELLMENIRNGEQGKLID